MLGSQGPLICSLISPMSCVHHKCGSVEFMSAKVQNKKEHSKCFPAFLQVRESGRLDVDVWTLSKNFFSWLRKRTKAGNVKN